MDKDNIRKEKQRKNALEYYYRNKDKRFEYYLNNKDKIRTYNTNYKRFKKYMNDGHKLTEEEKNKILDDINNKVVKKKLSKLDNKITGSKKRIIKGNIGDIIPFIQNKEISITLDKDKLTVLI
jgi:hypothetical protein